MSVRRFRQFFKWLAEQKDLKNHHQTMKKALAWCWGKMNEELEKLMLPKKQKGYVGSVPGVEKLVAETIEQARGGHLIAMEDWSSEIDGTISPEEMLKMVNILLSNELKTAGLLNTANTLYELRATHQMCARHEQLRAEVSADRGVC
jgi:hypothetical protein